MAYNAAALRERVEILTLTPDEGGWQWVPDRKTWAAVAITDKINLFSRVGIGARDAGLVLRRQPLTLDHGLHWKGQHLFLTSIIESRPGWLDVKAALVVPCDFTARHFEERPDPDRQNRPKRVEVKRFTFPGVLTEKYMRYEREESHAATDICMVLVTPKPVKLVTGDLVAQGAETWNVVACHTLDAWKNEYEMATKKSI